MDLMPIADDECCCAAILVLQLVRWSRVQSPESTESGTSGTHYQSYPSVARRELIIPVGTHYSFHYSIISAIQKASILENLRENKQKMGRLWPLFKQLGQQAYSYSFLH